MNENLAALVTAVGGAGAALGAVAVRFFDRRVHADQARAGQDVEFRKQVLTLVAELRQELREAEAAREALQDRYISLRENYVELKARFNAQRARIRELERRLEQLQAALLEEVIDEDDTKEGA